MTIARIAAASPAVPLPEQVQSNQPNAPDWRISAQARDKRQNALVVAELRRRGFHKQAGRLVECGNKVGYWHCVDCGDESRETINLCNMPRLCVRCARIERKLQQRLALETISTLRRHTRPGYDLREITLTIRTNGDYEGAVRRAGKALPELWRNVLGGRKRQDTGLLACFEFGPKTGNVHLHAIYWGPYVPQAVLDERWQHYTQGEGHAWITCNQDKPLEERVAHGVKYAHDFHSKGKAPEDVVTPERVVDVFEALDKKHMVLRRPYGLFRADVFKRWLADRPHLFVVRDIDEDVDNAIYCPCCHSHRRLYVFSYDTERGPPLRLHGVQRE